MCRRELLRLAWTRRIVNKNRLLTQLCVQEAVQPEQSGRSVERRFQTKSGPSSNYSPDNQADGRHRHSVYERSAMWNLAANARRPPRASARTARDDAGE